MDAKELGDASIVKFRAHNVELRLGEEVVVNEKSDYHADYKGEVWRVIGLDLEQHGRINVTIAQDGDFRGWHQPTDGFRPEELTRVR